MYLFENPELKPKGDYAEVVVCEFLRRCPGVAQVEDVRDDPAWQQQDVDYRVTLTSGTARGVEVKSDQHIARSGNVLFELARLHHTARPERCAHLGWSVFSAADWLLVYCPPARALYWFSFAALRGGMQAYMKDSRDKARLALIATDSQRTTLNILIPLAYVPHAVYAQTPAGWRRAS